MSDTHPIEAQNLSEIQGLNQRGGRMLSLVDLMAANTVSAEMAGYLLFAMKRGASLLSCARPGGAGKTALLGAVLNLLPPGERLVTIGSPGVLQTDPGKPACFLAHEIGAGRWYGYIWGDDVSAFLGKVARGYRVAATIHADYPDEIRRDMEPLGVSDTALSRVTVLAFILAERQGAKVQHTVHSIFESDGEGGFHLLFSGHGDRFAREAPSRLIKGAADQEDIEACVRFFEHLSCSPDLEGVRREVLRFYAGDAP